VDDFTIATTKSTGGHNYDREQKKKKVHPKIFARKRCLDCRILFVQAFTNHLPPSWCPAKYKWDRSHLYFKDLSTIHRSSPHINQPLSSLNMRFIQVIIMFSAFFTARWALVPISI